MKKTKLTAWTILSLLLAPAATQADPYVWDNQNGTGIWNDPVNWGLLNTPSYNVEPTAVDVAIFRSSSPAGTVTLTNDAFAVRVRQNISAPARTITIHPNQLISRTLTVTGTNAELFECTQATANLTLDGTPNGNGARLKLKIDDSGIGGTTVNSGVTLAINCDVSGAGGFILNAGSSGAGRLILGGSNTYTGPTTVNAGTLLVNGSVGPASAVSVAAGTTLGGNGTIGGAVSVAVNGTISPGSSIGTLSVNGNLSSAGKLVMEVDKSLTQSNDLISVNGTLNNTGNGTVTVVNLNPGRPLAPGDTFKLFNKPLANGGAMSIVSSGGEIWTNKLAVDGTIAVLPATSAPPAPLALAATSVTSNSFTANWNSSSGATGYRLDVATNNLFSNFVGGYQDLDVGNLLSWNVSGLSGTPSNYYRVRAYNASGTSGNSATILVPPPAPPPAPAVQAATSVTSNSFTANWNGSSGAIGYRLDVSTNNLFSSFVSGYQNLDVGNLLSWNVSGLNGSLTNYYRVRAYGVNGTSSNSATVTVVASTSLFPGDPTTTFIWNCTSDTDQDWSSGANWVGGVAPKPGSSNIIVFRGNILVPWNWPNIDTNYGTTILIFSNDVKLNGIKITAGMNHTMNLGSYVLNDQPADAESPSYFGIDVPIDIPWSQRGGGHIYTTNANFTNALGDASCGSQTDFKCVGARLDVYGVLKDGAGTSSKLIKSGEKTLNLTGQHGNTYTGGTIINAGPIKLAKPVGRNAIPGDVIANGSGGLVMNAGGEQIADNATLTFNDSAYFDLGGQSETVGTIQSTSANARIYNLGSTFTVSPAAGGAYDSGAGVSDFAGSISGSGTLRKNGTGTYGMLGANSVANLIVNSGTLKVNGNSGTGTVTVNAGGTLLGQGTIAGAVTVATGGTLGAGFSAGKLTLPAGLNLSASGNGPTNVWELAALKDGTTGVAGADYDQIALTGGTLALGTQATLDIRFTGTASAPDAGNPFWQTPHAWTILSLSGASNPNASNFGRLKNASYAAGNFTTAATAGGIVLTFTPVTPPATVRPGIAAITNGAAGSVTVSYTNTLPGTNYVLSYTTNVGATNWFTAGSKTASSVSDSQTDNSATNQQRYYRVYYVTP